MKCRFVVFGLLSCAGVFGAVFFLDAVKQTPVRICAVRLVSSGLVALAHQLDYFEKNGLKPDIKYEELGRTCIENLRGGKTDFAVAYLSPSVSGSIGTNFRFFSEVSSSTRNTSVLYRKNSGVKKPSDLIGKRIGYVPGTSSEALFILFLKVHGIGANQLKIVRSNVTELSKQFLAQKLDAIVIWQPIAERFFRSADEVASFEAPYITEFSGISGSQDSIHNPNLGKPVLNVLHQAQLYWTQHPETAKDLMLRELGYSKADISEKIWTSTRLSLGLTYVLMTMIQLERQIQTSTDLKIPIDKSNLDDFIDEEPLLTLLPEMVTFK